MIEDDHTYFHCIKCGKNSELECLPQRNTLNQPIGVIFACSECMDDFVGKAIELRIGTEDYSNGQVFS